MNDAASAPAAGTASAQPDHESLALTDPTTGNEHVPASDPARGLSAAQAAQLAAEGKANTLPDRSGRSAAQIVRDNVFTRINFMLGVLFIAVILTGSWINSAFGLLIIANSIIGIIQELRAKHTLDSLAVIGEAHPRVRREGEVREIAREEVVLGDIIVVAAGEQIVVDGVVTEADYLEVDESLLTGESDSIHKEPGAAMMSGSFVSSGSGSYRATRVGAEAYAAKLTSAASKFSLVDSQLQNGIDRILKAITWVLVPVGLLTIWGQIRVVGLDWAAIGAQWRDIVLSVTGALVPMIPEGLVLITSTAFALGVIRLGRLNVLVNELPAIEGLARVDTVAVDKTGTLTENTLRFAGLELVPGAASSSGSASGSASGGASSCSGSGSGPVCEQHDAAATPAARAQAIAREALAQLGAADPAPNSSMEAIQEALGAPAQPWKVAERQPFTSAKKWSGVSFANGQHWIMGAPDVLLDLAGTCGPAGAVAPTGAVVPHGNTAATSAITPAAAINAARERAAAIAATGQRVLLLARSDTPVTAANAPGNIEPLAFILLDQKIRPDASDTLRYFDSQGVAVKVISGDNAAAVGAVTTQLGVNVGTPVDARTIPEASFAETINENAVFGRVTPDQKRAMVAALRGAGHTVAMTGDGVNDVLALKDADLGIGMGSGTSATRSVAKIVLLDDKFASLPHVVGEGRRVVGNIERVARLFLTKTVYSAVLAIAVLLFALPYPFVPIHVTITGWFTIGIPAFLLSLPPNNDAARPGFVQRVMRFGFPAGLIVGVATFITYVMLYDGAASSAYATQVSTATLLTMIIASSWVLVVVARPYVWWKILLILLPLLGYGVIFLWPFTQRIFMLDSSNTGAMALGTLVGLSGAALIEALWWFLGLHFGEPARLWQSAEQRAAQRTQAELRKKATAERRKKVTAERRTAAAGAK
ncbi:HAD-IC family P-type ATPase [Actinotignum sp. SLA_B059]|uniref:HAD-IC family P-type ATPase n=1 Tax=Actinotignum sp. SLA_B059 TaxID=3083287 RepID=UPI002A807522|nr:HAD-IC family P-type ATPase [Actinotignum sp. SLA_B059]MDY5127558.1 HAD-IC family P-type ATPase [Actinotignum sp. SLA_B059]